MQQKKGESAAKPCKKPTKTQQRHPVTKRQKRSKKYSSRKGGNSTKICKKGWECRKDLSKRAETQQRLVKSGGNAAMTHKQKGGGSDITDTNSHGTPVGGFLHPLLQRVLLRKAYARNLWYSPEG